jgi:predicted nucleotidyltransferase
MASIVANLAKRGLIKPPSYAIDTQYEVITGSVSYGVSSGSSDLDVVGFCIPSKEIVFPHLAGIVQGFGSHGERFDQFQQHHIEDKEGRKEYDLTVYNIVKFFQLCMENNPNMVDALFVSQRCVLHITKIGQMVRDNRKEFLHKGCFYKFRGYSYSQLHKARIKQPTGKRKEIVDKLGFDPKFLYHCVRLLDETEQILIEGDLDLERNKEYLKEIRRGEVSLERVEEYFQMREKYLEEVYQKSTLPHSPDEQKIKNLLLSCLEEFYGNLNNCIKTLGTTEQIINDLKLIVNKYS